MARICRTHCPVPSGVPWGLLLAVAGVWGIAHVLIAAGKTALIVILGTALAAVGTTVTVAICGAICNLGTAATAAASVADLAHEQTPAHEPTPDAPASNSLCEPPSERPQLRLVRDEEAA